MEENGNGILPGGLFEADEIHVDGRRPSKPKAKHKELLRGAAQWT